MLQRSKKDFQKHLAESCSPLQLALRLDLHRTSRVIVTSPPGPELSVVPLWFSCSSYLRNTVFKHCVGQMLFCCLQWEQLSLAGHSYLGAEVGFWAGWDTGISICSLLKWKWSWFCAELGIEASKSLALEIVPLCLTLFPFWMAITRNWHWEDDIPALTICSLLALPGSCRSAPCRHGSMCGYVHNLAGWLVSLPSWMEVPS